MPNVRLVRNEVMTIHEVEIHNGYGSRPDIRRVIIKRPLLVRLLIRRVIIKTNLGPLLVRLKGRKLIHVSELSPMLWELKSRLKSFAVCSVRLDYYKVEHDDGSESCSFVENKQLDEMEFVDVEEKVGDAA